MKFKFSLKNKEASAEADVEGLISKAMDKSAERSDGKTHYEIKQEQRRETERQKQEEELLRERLLLEEQRKSKELNQKHSMQWMFILLGMLLVCIVLGVVAHYLGI